MNIKGIHKTSLIDYPGKISSVIFTGGCNLRCGYCHNPDLACNSCNLQSYSNDDALSFIQKRRKLIDGITISGGEPTLARNIDRFILSVKSLSLSVKIDTNGLNPGVIRRLIDHGLVDYVAVDIKTSPEKYPFLTGKPVDFQRIVETVNIVRDSGIEHEMRTTCIPDYVTLQDFAGIKRAIGQVDRYYLQQFVNTVTLDESFNHYTPYPAATLYEFKKYIETFARICEIRGL